MTTFLAVYRGMTVAEAKMIAVTADPNLVSMVATHLLEDEQQEADPVVTAIDLGRRAALRLIHREASHVDE